MKKHPSLFLGLLLGAAGWAAAAETPAKVSFNRDIRPILSETCYSCHGPDKPARKGGRRLDTSEGARAENDGVRALVPGDLEKSELIARVVSSDPDYIMPPPKSERKLKPAQIALLKTWVQQGGEYERHWSLIPPQRPPIPEAPAGSAPAGAIDAFIRARLAAEGLKPSPPASPAILIRRLTYDLTGLPPTPAEVDLFVSDTAPGAWERLVDRLLASPRYGEKMAVHWLDLARYADTHGYHLDAGRSMWPWRDWVIAAFNRNLPFDQFALWQLAGDLLPKATVEQRLATGFCRNSMINFEGGAIADEYLAAYVKDRTNTFATAFLGMTLACCECHDHKFDPFTQREYYQLFAYFNAVPERGLDGSKGNAPPLLKVPTAEQEAAIARLQGRIAEAGQRPETPAAELEALRKQLEEVQKSVPDVMVMEQMPVPRETHVLVRGQYNQLGDAVVPGTPASLPPLASGAPPNRLGLAQWVIDRGHPLTARVAVNRFWKNLMGAGLVKTLNDFGAQGEWPSHPELLDWLACEFMDSGWDVKHLVRLIVTSETYRQSARVTPELRERDPLNRLYARGPRYRLSAEEIRDTALAASGLLTPRIGGPSVSPYQPDGLWQELSSRGDSKKWTAQFYEQSHGPDLYRRSLYTFWKRTCPPPQLQAFDAPDRETCTVSRERTNTPLQALVLLNDPTYLEAARVLAERLIAEGGATPAERVRMAFARTVARAPTAQETALLTGLFEREAARFAAHPEDAQRLLTVGEHPRDASMREAEVAAWTSVVSAILNLDETMTRG